MTSSPSGPFGAPNGTAVPVGRRTTVQVPASTANLGPGFDTLGLALALYDDVTVEVIPEGLVLDLTGEGAETLPRTAEHYVVRALCRGLEEAGASAPGLAVTCHNRIPQSRGLGSSAAALVAGVAAASGLTDGALDTDAMVQIASTFEGHPDNAAASVLGGAIVSWTEVPVDGSTLQYRAVPLPVHESIQATALVPRFHASTDVIRGVLPSDVSHVDARFNVSRVAVMVMALRDHPDLLWEGTRDRLHQTYRSDALPVTAEWVNRLRNKGYPAYLSGAGPTVMVLSTEPVAEVLRAEATAAGLDLYDLEIAGPVSIETGGPSSATGAIGAAPTRST